MVKLLAPFIDGVMIINHDSDIFKSALLEDGISFEQAAKLAYRLDWAFAEDFVRQERSVIIDSTCNYPAVLDQGTALAQRHGYDYWYVECRVDDVDLLDERLRTRVPLRSQRTGVDRPPPDAGGAHSGEDSRALFQKWIKHPCRPVDNIIVVDSTGSLEEHRDYILARIFPPTGVQSSNQATPESGFCKAGSDA